MVIYCKWIALDDETLRSNFKHFSLLCITIAHWIISTIHSLPSLHNYMSSHVESTSTSVVCSQWKKVERMFRQNEEFFETFIRAWQESLKQIHKVQNVTLNSQKFTYLKLINEQMMNLYITISDDMIIDFNFTYEYSQIKSSHEEIFSRETIFMWNVSRVKI
jgi:hypothetical protein